MIHSPSTTMLCQSSSLCISPSSSPAQNWLLASMSLASNTVIRLMTFMSSPRQPVQPETARLARSCGVATLLMENPPVQPVQRNRSGRELIDELEAQESRLVFDRFDDDTAWRLGVALRDAASAGGLPIAISVRRNGRLLFYAAMPGSSADNEGWLARKCAVVDRYGHSSLRVGEQFRVDGKSFDKDSRLDPAEFAAHGGAFPILLRGTGCVGTVAVSGLPQLEDHQLVGETIAALLDR
jgi:uncharacterized protein (UPF0303 family)